MLALSQEVAERPIVKPVSVAESTPQQFPSTGTFVEILSFGVDEDNAQLLVTAFAQINTEACQDVVDVTLRVVLDGQTLESYPPMTWSVAPNKVVPGGLGGLVPIDDGYGQGDSGPHTVSLEASVEPRESIEFQDCVMIEARNMNGSVVVM